MRLREQVIKAFAKAIVIPVVILLILTSIIFKGTFDKYLKHEQKLNLEKIEKITNVLFNNPKDLIAFNDIIPYIIDENMHLMYYNNDGDLIYEINRIPAKAEQDENNYTEKRVDIVDKNDYKIAELCYRYLNNSYIDSRSLKFRNNLINLFLGSLIIAIIAGLTLSTYLSKSLTVPILKLSKSTKYIKEGYYEDIDLPESDTFEIQMLSNDIDYLAQSLKVQDDIRKNYAQDISHELRTPLTNLQLHIMAMQDGIIEKSDENFNLMLNELDRLNGLVADLKSSFDQGSKNIKINNTNFNLTNLLDDIVNTSRPNFNKHNIKLSSKLNANMEVYMDKDKLTQIIYNLLSNALKATPENGFVTVSLKRTSEKILISVNDTGVGISEKDLEQIFNRFYRVDSARNTKENGYGLGLSIVKNMMDAMGGKIIVNSKENIGTEFILEFNKEMVKAIEIIEPNIE